MRWIVACLLVGCAAGPSEPVGVDPGEASGDGKADGASGTPDVRCEGAPDAGPKADFRHFSSKVISKLGSPRHRGYDLIAASADDKQVIAGAISYTIADKALEDEDVELFACRAGTWKKLGTTRTDDEGRFALALTGSKRLPVGMRDMFVSVSPDRTGVKFLALVGGDGIAMIASDVDGTLTSSEGAFVETIVTGNDVDERTGAPAALRAAAAKGYQLVYVTARGQQNMEATRGWLDRKGFPRGPLRLAPSFVTLPGNDTVDYKTETLSAIAAALPLVAGIGNRASDVTAYTNAGVAADRIFIETPEYADEVQPLVDDGQARGFATYDELRTGAIADLPAN